MWYLMVWWPLLIFNMNPTIEIMNGRENLTEKLHTLQRVCDFGKSVLRLR